MCGKELLHRFRWTLLSKADGTTKTGEPDILDDCFDTRIDESLEQVLIRNLDTGNPCSTWVMTHVSTGVMTPVLHGSLCRPMYYRGRHPCTTWVTYPCTTWVSNSCSTWVAHVHPCSTCLPSENPCTTGGDPCSTCLPPCHDTCPVYIMHQVGYMWR